MHVELDIHFVREEVALGQFKVLQIPTQHQFADIMTKGLPTPLFNEFRDSLCIQSTEAATTGGVSKRFYRRQLDSSRISCFS